MSSKKSDPLKSDTFAPAALLQVQPNYSSSPHISQSIGHVTSPLIAAKLLPMPGRTSVSPSTDSAQKGAAETPWQCKECGVGETETPLKRKGPDGTRNLCNACYVRWRVKCERAERGSARPTAQQIASTARMMQTPPIAWTASQPMSPSNGATSMQMGRLATAQRNGYPSRVQTSPSVTTFPPQNMTWSPYLTANPAAGLGSYYSTVREGQDIAFFVNGNGSPIETADPAQLMNVMPGFNPAQTRAQRKGSSASEYSLESPVGTTRNKGRGSQSPSNKRKAASPTGHSNKRNK